METFRIQSVAQLAGVRVHQLRYWGQTGLIRSSIKEASGSGFSLIYSEDDVTAAQQVGELRKQGVSLQKIRKAVARLTEQLPGRNVLVECNFTTDGKNIFVSGSNGLIDVSSNVQLELPFVES